MFNIETIATGSKGNCYRIDDGITSLLIECGIAFKQIQQALDFKTSSVSGVLVSHEHMDHAKSVKAVSERGLDVYMSKGTKDALNIESNRIKVIESRKQFRIGSWIVLPFDIQHDANEPLGFLLQSDAGEKLLFATDTYYVKYKFPGLTHIMIECNYDQQTLDENLQSGRIHPMLRKRVMKSHFSLEHLLEFFAANDLSKVQEIHLLHLSDSNSNKERIYEQVAKATGKLIYIP